MTAALSRERGSRFLGALIQLAHTARERFIRHSSVVGEIAQDHWAKRSFDDHVIRPVSSLFGGRSPSTVPWLIVSVDIDAIERCSFWARPHVSKEGREVLLPCLVHPDASAAILRVFRIVRIVAARLCMVARLQLRRRATIHRMPMLEAASTSLLGPDAPAADSLAASDGLKANLLRRAAIAREGPNCSASSVRSAMQRHQPAVTLTRNINRCDHGALH